MNKEIATNHVEYFADLEAERIYEIPPLSPPKGGK
tara:strand:+ start:1774 stop:1878 length:105 start_codon:yes stop_codon:yes gene_type:complete